jgi:hypothetical protein
MMVNYDGGKFVSVLNSGSGEVGVETRFTYHQRDDVVRATYSGGAIRFATLVAIDGARRPP